MDPLERSSSSEVLGPFSLPPSPPSEPPDIRNWFQSYEYESPEPSGLPFGLESHEEDAEQADFSENTRSPLSIEHDLNTLYGSNIQTRKSLPRNLIRDPECLPVPQAEDQGHIQGANFHHIGRNASSLDSILVDKDQRSLDGHVRISKSEIGDSYIPESVVSRMNETLTKDDGSICRSVTRKVISQEDKSLSSHEDDHSNKTAGAPSSWISTRFGKHSQADDKRLSMKKFVKKDNAKEEETSRLNGASREPLAERTNLLYRQLEEMKEAEIPGKWKCPRSKKPRRGPPLKQLRLEYWVWGQKTGLAKVREGLYYLTMSKDEGGSNQLPSTWASTVSEAPTVEEKAWLYHRRLGHPSFSTLTLLFLDLLKTIQSNRLLCDVCEQAKHKRHSYISDASERRKEPFQLIHCDVWGPAPLVDLNGFRWFLVCIDDFSRFSWIFLLKQKSEVSIKFKNFSQMIERQYEKKIKILRTDNAKDFCNLELQNYFAELGIIHETSCAYTPQQNGVAERRIGLIQEKGHALLLQSHAPTFLWGEAMLTATTLVNRVITPVLDGKSPLDVLSAEFPLVKIKNSLPPRIFGCECYVHLYPIQTNKFSSRAINCVFIGYSNTQKGYKCYYPTGKKIITSIDVTFDEGKYFYLRDQGPQNNLLPSNRESIDPTRSGHNLNSNLVSPYTQVYVRGKTLNQGEGTLETNLETPQNDPESFNQGEGTLETTLKIPENDPENLGGMDNKRS